MSPLKFFNLLRPTTTTMILMQPPLVSFFLMGTYYLGQNIFLCHSVYCKLDIIGSSISLASKIVSIAKPSQVLVGESIYNILLTSESIRNSKFIEINLDPTK